MKKQNKILLIIHCLCFASVMMHAQTVDSLSAKEIYSLYFSSGSPSNIPIIDGRDSSMFMSGHIKYAFYCDAYSKTAHECVVPLLLADTVIVYCTTHRRSLTIIEILGQKYSYNGHIIFMSDGIQAWKSHSFPLENYIEASYKTD